MLRSLSDNLGLTLWLWQFWLSGTIKSRCDRRKVGVSRFESSAWDFRRGLSGVALSRTIWYLRFTPQMNLRAWTRFENFGLLATPVGNLYLFLGGIKKQKAEFESGKKNTVLGFRIFIWFYLIAAIFYTETRWFTRGEERFTPDNWGRDNRLGLSQLIPQFIIILARTELFVQPTFCW